MNGFSCSEWGRIDCMFSDTAVAAQHRGVSHTTAPSPSQHRLFQPFHHSGLMGGNVYRKVQVSSVSGMRPPSEMISKLMSWSSLKQPDWQECKSLFKKGTWQVSSSGEQQEVFSNKRYGSSRKTAWMGLALKRTFESVVHTL